MTTENCAKLVNLGVDCVSISLDSLDPQTYNQVRGKFDETAEGINNLLKIKSENMGVEIMMTVSRLNVSSIRPMVDYCEENGLNLWLDPVEINPNVAKMQPLDLTKMTKGEINTLREEFNYWANKMGNSSLLGYVEGCIQTISGEKVESITCEMGTNHFVLDVDGSVHPCFSRKDIDYGNVFSQDLQTVLKNPLVVEKQRELQSAGCVSLGCICMTIVSDYYTTASN